MSVTDLLRCLCWFAVTSPRCSLIHLRPLFPYIHQFETGACACTAGGCSRGGGDEEMQGGYSASGIYTRDRSENQHQRSEHILSLSIGWVIIRPEQLICSQLLPAPPHIAMLTIMILAIGQMPEAVVARCQKELGGYMLNSRSHSHRQPNDVCASTEFNIRQSIFRWVTSLCSLLYSANLSFNGLCRVHIVFDMMIDLLL
jgi:hypothetical protein